MYKKYIIEYNTYFIGGASSSNLEELIRQYNETYESVLKEFGQVEKDLRDGDYNLKKLERDNTYNNNKMERDEQNLKNARNKLEIEEKKTSNNSGYSRIPYIENDIKQYESSIEKIKLEILKVNQTIKALKLTNETAKKRLQQLQSYGDRYYKYEFQLPELIKLRQEIQQIISHKLNNYLFEDKIINKNAFLNQNQINHILDLSVLDYSNDYYTKDIVNLNSELFSKNHVCFRKIKKYTTRELIQLYNNNKTTFLIPNFLDIEHIYYEKGFDRGFNLEDLSKNEFKPKPKDLYTNRTAEEINQEIQKYLQKNIIKRYTLDLDIIPLGRLNYQFDTQFNSSRSVLYLLRDLLYYRHMKNILQVLKTKDKINNTLFINYTGHGGQFILNLLELGIDFCIQYPIQTIKMALSSTLDQLQDTSNMVINKKITNKTSLGIVLMSSHGLGELYDINRFPTLEIIKKYGFKRIVVITEDHYKLDPYLEKDREFLSAGPKRLDTQQDSLTKYLYHLMKDIPIEFYGANENITKTADYSCP
ncbi:hypothetical protein CPAV1605_741 [seawater metagenome]|uniref:Uncharacterized protein n=1 Tax=seawater metagenome TaxID=1561972 RepID=A0A5E8CIT7_9ZZZZ